MSKDKGIRVDKEFDKKIKNIINRRLDNGMDVEPKSTRAITKMMAQSRGFKMLEKELTETDDLMRSETGALSDPFIWMISGIVIVFVLAGMWYGYDKIHEVVYNIPETGGLNFSEAKEMTFEKVDPAFNLLRVIGFFIFMASGVSIWVSNRFTTTRAEFFILYIFIMLVAVVASAYIANSYVDLRNLQIFEGKMEEFGYINYFYQYLPWIVAVMMGIGLIIGMVSKSQSKVYATGGISADESVI